jgi:hypothetical protein
MASLHISQTLAEKLERAAHERGCSIEDLLGTIIAPTPNTRSEDPLIAFTVSPEYRVKFSDADRFLALLSWIAAHHRGEFNDFVSHLESRRRYVGLSADEIRETCRHNQARPIPGTHYWAIMNLDSPTKRRFLRRLLVFVGAADTVIDAVLSTLGTTQGTFPRVLDMRRSLGNTKVEPLSDAKEPPRRSGST